MVIGSVTRYLDSPAGALARVTGCAVNHDVSERALQIGCTGQWDKGK